MLKNEHYDDLKMHKSVFGNKLTSIKKMLKLQHFYDFLDIKRATDTRLVNGLSVPDGAVLNTIITKVMKATDGKRLDMNWLVDDDDRREGPVFVGDMVVLPSATLPTASEEVTPNSPTPIADLPPGNAVRRKGDQDAAHKVLHLRAVGSAAAFQAGASRGGFDNDALYWDRTEEIPESTHLIKICGDSMAPVMMHGQSVMVGTLYRTEIGEVPRNRELVVAEVTVQNNDIGGVDGEWEGVHCKRIQDGGDFWLFTSINPSGATFSVAKDNCRLWHVIGVYFGEKSKIPEED